MLVVSILFVIIGQFSYSTALDRALAQNYQLDTQIRCDCRSALALLRAALAQETEQNSISIELATGTAHIRWTSEAGKFNINTLRSEDNALALDQFEKLFQLLEENGTVSVLGLSHLIADFVRSSPRPLLSMGELKQIGEITDAVIDGGEGTQGLAHFLTVYSDGQINIGDAPPEVIACLDQGINNQETIQLLTKKLEDPEARVPGYVSVLARRLEASVTTDSRAYLATISLSGSAGSRKTEVAVRKEEDVLRVVLYNEASESHETYDQ